MFEVDPKIEAFEAHVYEPQLVKDVWKKYYWPKGNERHPDQVYQRVAKAIANSPAEQAKGSNIGGSYAIESVENAFLELMRKRLFLPGGRILAGAGTDKVVTLMNCYVNGTLEDSMKGIMDGVSRLALTSQQGGGMGTAFETIRPKNAILQRTQSAASGILPFMDVFSQTGKTIRSAGERRAAQMGTISDTHPDLPEFIVAKGNGLKDGSMRLSEFNVSVLISDAFKAAVDDDEDWFLYFSIPPVNRDPELVEKDFEDDQGTKQYVYSVWKARELWKLITENTYEYSDPGVIFIDRINEWNNLNYCEEIRCTNPCGEQPLPPNGTCNLGAINVANCVVRPFTTGAAVNYDLIAEVSAWGVRFLDNVINVTGYPLPEQEQEEFNKRRIGLGLLGLGTMFHELCIRYGSIESVETAERVMKTICLAAYDESMRLAEERGSFPLFQDIIIDCGFIKYRLDDKRKERIVTTGLRNGVILTIAPVGTGSIAFGNVSSGLEPDFSHEYDRRVRSKNTEEFTVYREQSYTKRFYEFCTGKKDMEGYTWCVTAHDLTILDHIKVQSALQKWVDASTSKTINIPAEMPYEQFVEVYDLAYKYDLKGCTTYRPSTYRESILTDAKAAGSGLTTGKPVLDRPIYLEGGTHKFKWPTLKAAMYVTINYLDGKPYEIFFSTKDAKFQDWMTGLTLMISSIFRIAPDPSFIIHELSQVVSAHDTGFYNQKHYGSLVARLADVIKDDFIRHGIIEADKESVVVPIKFPTSLIWESNKIAAETCPECLAPTLVHKEGCESCTNCGYNKCS